MDNVRFQDTKTVASDDTLQQNVGRYRGVDKRAARF
jgi:hypothetical protein